MNDLATARARDVGGMIKQMGNETKRLATTIQMQTNILCKTRYDGKPYLVQMHTNLAMEWARPANALTVTAEALELATVPSDTNQ